MKNPIRALAATTCLGAVLLATALYLLLPPPGGAEAARRNNGPSLIRDAEIEDTIRSYAAPLFEAAGLQPDTVEVNLVDDAAINAFVAGGQRIFIHTGLLLASENANQVMGVIAHETGHIAGGHLARMEEYMRGASAEAILAMLMGAAAAMAGRSGDAGMAVMAGGTHIAERNLLQYSRVQESSADQAGLTFLERAHKSGRGLERFLEILGDQELLLADRQDPYVRTHPISRERIELLKDLVAKAHYSNVTDTPEEAERHARMKAKLRGFLDLPQQAFRFYPEKDQSLPARYARAIARHKAGEHARAVSETDALIAERPRDPYFYELKGQILLESGQAAASLAPYQRSVELLPNSALMHANLGQAMLAVDGDAYVKPAIEQLREAVKGEPRNASAWNYLAQAYGRSGDVAMASLASAERYSLGGMWRDALLQAERAMRMLPVGSPGNIRAQDIKTQAQNEMRKKQRQ